MIPAYTGIRISIIFSYINIIIIHFTYVNLCGMISSEIRESLINSIITYAYKNCFMQHFLLNPFSLKQSENPFAPRILRLFFISFFLLFFFIVFSRIWSVLYLFFLHPFFFNTVFIISGSSYNQTFITGSSYIRIFLSHAGFLYLFYRISIEEEMTYRGSKPGNGINKCSMGCSRGNLHDQSQYCYPENTDTYDCDDHRRYRLAKPSGCS